MNVRHLLLVLFLCVPAAWAQIKLKAGDLTLSASGHSEAFCVQIPILMEETSIDGRELLTITFTVELGGDTHIIDGNLATEMLVVGGFSTYSLAISNPPVDLENQGADPTPTCPIIVNQATQGYPELTSAPGLFSTSWFLSNNAENRGYKQGFGLDIFLNTIGTTSLNQEQMVAVLEIPIIANPGEAVLTITPVPTATVEDGNTFQYRSGGLGVSEDFDLSDGQGALRFCPQTLASQPADVSACPGDDVSFSVNVSGSGPFSYQWYHNDVALAGAEDASLALTNIGFGDLGAYHCEISSPCAVVETAAGTLSIGSFTATVDPPGLALGLTPPTFTTTTSCEIPSVAYEWRDSQNNLVGSDATLTLDPPPTANEVYSFLATDGGDRTVTSQISVLVNPLGTDLDGDNMNTLADLHLVLPFWLGNAFDADGNGVLDVRDMLYINTGQ